MACPAPSTPTGAATIFTTQRPARRRDQPTQVGRALAQLGIEHIAAYSPEARGRSERAFRTLQDRLPRELALAGITTPLAANRFIAEIYLPEHNARFALPPEQPETAFVKDRAGAHHDILCIQEERVVGNDNRVRYRGLAPQIPPSPLRQVAAAGPRRRQPRHLPRTPLPRPLPGRRQPTRPTP
jgi:hypothetical protein